MRRSTHQADSSTLLDQPIISSTCSASNQPVNQARYGIASFVTRYVTATSSSLLRPVNALPSGTTGAKALVSIRVTITQGNVAALSQAAEQSTPALLVHGL
jgi:hypothetical protein